mmetsp:Transcript_121995/g.352442  ORF Transcript_121995/g.352442 Transcript_121995/m.352442 type:complete len:405 (+) Transcript_121995:50-1264(+)
MFGAAETPAEAFAIPVEPVAVPFEPAFGVDRVDLEERQLADAATAWLRGRIDRQRQDGVWRISFQGFAQADRGLQALGAALPGDLKALEIELPSASSVSDVGLRSLAQGLDRLQCLTRFELRCPMCEAITDAAMKAIFRSLEALSSLLEICLDISLCPQLTDETLNAVASLLAHFGSLEANARPSEDDETTLVPPGPCFRSVELVAHACRNFTDKALNRFGEAVALLKGVSSLSLSFAEPGPSVTSLGLTAILQCMEGMTGLEQFVLVLQGCTELYESGLVILCAGLAEKTKLRHVVLNFHGCLGVTSAGLVMFSDVFKTAQDLFSVTLDVTSCDKVVDKGIEEFCTQLRHKKTLKRVLLRVGGTQVSQNALPLLKKEMSSLESFQVSTAIRTSAFTGVSVTFK